MIIPLFIGNLGPTELVVILIIVLILFGGKRLPALARSIGSGITEFKKGITDGERKEHNPSPEDKSDKKS